MSIVLLWMATQIIVESFPVSSSGHIKLLEIFLKQRSMADSLLRMPEHFDDFLHGPSLVVLALFFFHRWYGVLRHFIKFKRLFFSIVLRTALAASVTVLFYLFFQYVPIVSMFPLGLGFCITALLLFSLKWCPSDSYESYNIWKALLLGAVQGLALLPGISRLGSTYVIARWLKLSPRHAIEASFAMQAPLILVAFARGSIKAIQSPYLHEVLNVKTCLVMMISSAIAYAGLCVVMYMARQHKLWMFSYYMLVPLAMWLVLSI